MKTYSKFLTDKARFDEPTGHSKVPKISTDLFDFQRDIVGWALRRGRAAIFADCGLGKTPMQLEWAKHVPGDVLILAPLAVSAQTVREGKKFGIPVNRCQSQKDVKPGINIANYERMEAFDATKFKGVVLDESSILKSYDGKTRTLIIEAFERTPYRLAATATPSPNDYMELGNHAEFLGVMTRQEMLSMFFVHDGGETQKWRIKGHAEADFWKWVCSWAVMIRRPSDLGYDDGKFKLPSLNMNEHIVRATHAADGDLFAMPAATLQERIQARRATVNDRVAKCRGLVLNFKYDEKRTLGEVVCEKQRIPKGEGTGVVSPEQTQDRQRQKEGISERLLPEEPGQIYKNGIGKCNTQYEPKNEIQDGCKVSRRGKKKIQGVALQKPGKEEGPEASEIRANDCAVQFDDGEPGQQVRDLRTQRNGKSAILPNGGSLPRNGESTRDSLLELQHGNREIQARSVVASKGDSLSESRAEKWIIWCNLNKEQDALAKAFGKFAVSIQGSTPSEKKESLECEWREGDVPILITKPDCFGFGMNWQHCANVVFVGLSDSYESFYQAVRRSWRFGQKKPVNVHLIVADIEGAVLQNIHRKENDAAKMAERMVDNMKDLNAAAVHGGATKRQKTEYKTAAANGDRWTMRLGDCVDGMVGIGSDSLHYSIYSPPFASLYTYSNSDRDMGNCTDTEQFLEHYRFLVKEIFRATMPGRLTSFHCMDLPTSKVRDGIIGLRDFRGELVRIHQEAGFVYHSGVTIWKDPVTAMQRTKAIGLLYKQLKKDSHLSRQGIPDYLVTMRKPGENPEPITHTPDDFPVDLWQKYASPVWMDINPNETLQYRSARENNDERHVCPLQLEVIRRGLKLWSNPGDLVLSPFAGIGSEGHEAVKGGRRFLGYELKSSYFACAVNNLKAAERSMSDGLLL